jgi:hypothetical protein
MLSFDVFNAYKKREVLSSFDITKQEIKMENRKILFDWLKDIVQNPYRDDEKDPNYFDIELEVVYTSIGIMDKYMQANKIKLKRYQLLGLSALFLAWKFHSRDYCKLTLKEKAFYNCMDLCCNIYTKKDFIDMEMELLRCLDYQIERVNIPEIVSMLRDNDDGCCEKVTAFSRKILWILFLSGEVLRYKPTIIASSILYISKAEENVKAHWSKKSATMTNYNLKKLQKCISDIYKLL